MSERDNVTEETQPFQLPDEEAVPGEGADDVGRDTPTTDDGDAQSEPADK